MPTYEYKCEGCGYVYEVFHKISQEPLKKCPQCHQDRLKRGIGGQNAVLTFKGSGFYITDYAQKAESAPPSKDSSKEAK